MSAMPNHKRTQAVNRWVVDPARSTLEFRVKNFWGLATVVGHFTRFAGSYTASADSPEIEVIVEAASLNTGNRKRDEHLRSNVFFNAEAHPQIRFAATEIADVGDGTLRVRGELEVAGKKVQLSFVARTRELDDALEVEATTLVDHRLFGMTWSPFRMVRSPTIVHVKARFTSTASDHQSSRDGSPARRPAAA